MNRALLVIAVAALLSVTCVANAAIFMDTDFWHGQKLSAGGAGVSSTFNIVTGDGDFGDISGFQPGIDVVSSAFVTIFAFDDLDLSSETVSVDLGTLPGDTQHFEKGFFLGFSGFPEPVSGTLFGDINADGILAYTITASRGDFCLEKANLTVTTGCGPAIPEPATIVIWFLLASMAIVVGRRRSAA